MVDPSSRDIDYTHADDRMIGYFVLPQTVGEPRALPGILLVHDAFGLGDDMMRVAERYAALGFAVFAADVWGERTTPATDDQIGPLIGGMVADRARWIGRIAAAHEALAAQPEVNSAALVAVGYCFGGSSALEYLRVGGDIRGVVCVHGGLDLLDPQWPATAPDAREQSARPAPPRVLLCSGADDPMATADMRERLQSSLSAAGIDWELDLYSDTRHAFTNPKSDFSPMPDVVAYNERSAARAWAATERFLGELFADALAANR